MNYIKQINAFWNWRKYNDDISHSAADLYFAILHCANEAGWKTQVNIPNSTLMSTSQIGNKSVLSSLRNNLVQKGLIKYIPGKKGKAPGYIIVTLYSTNSATNHSANQVTDVEIGTNTGSAQNTHKDTDSDTGMAQDTYLHTYPNTYTETNSATNQRTIYKHKQKQNENNITAAVTDDNTVKIFERYENLTGKPMSETAMKDIDSFISDGVSHDLILSVMDYAVDADKGNWNYMRGTLEGLLAEGVKTVEAWKRQQAEYKQRNQNGSVKAQKSKFNNYEDTNKIDYAALEEKLLDMMLEW